MAEGELGSSAQPAAKPADGEAMQPCPNPAARTAGCAPDPWLVVLPPRAVHRRHVHILTHHILGALMEGWGTGTAKSCSAGRQGCACPAEEAEPRACWHPALQPCPAPTSVEWLNANCSSVDSRVLGSYTTVYMPVSAWGGSGRAGRAGFRRQGAACSPGGDLLPTLQRRHPACLTHQPPHPACLTTHTHSHPTCSPAPPPTTQAPSRTRVPALHKALHPGRVLRGPQPPHAAPHIVVGVRPAAVAAICAGGA